MVRKTERVVHASGISFEQALRDTIKFYFPDITDKVLQDAVAWGLARLKGHGTATIVHLTPCNKLRVGGTLFNTFPLRTPRRKGLRRFDLTGHYLSVNDRMVWPS